MKQLLIKVRNHFLPNPTVNTLSSSPSILWRGFEGVFGIDRIHRFQGGLSNQMFQYSYAFALQQRFPARVRVDLCGYANVHPEMQYRIEEVFTLPDRFPVVPNNFARAAKTLTRLSGRDWSFEHTVEYKEAYLGDDLRGFVQGYFPSFKYSAEVESLIRRNFVFRQTPPASAARLFAMMEKAGSVAVHVRRGDYLTPQCVGIFGGICPPRFYRSAMAMIRARFPSARFYFFSDDPEWCRAEFGSEAAEVITGHQGDRSWVDMMLMSRCQHAIVPNSGFSLWARWLGGLHGNICIGPDRFTNAGAHGTSIEDILPPEFIRLNSEGAVVWNGIDHG